ncbi:MAG: hypothetical protein PF444_09965, partial [Bacteroidales bacterium]|nr:hypothetical protein [Bacteroidales bacterium]
MTSLSAIDLSHLLPFNFPKITPEQTLLTIVFAVGGRTYHKVDIYHRAIAFQKECEAYDFGKLNTTTLKLALDGLLFKGIVVYDRYYEMAPSYFKGVAQQALSDPQLGEAYSSFMHHGVSWILNESEIRYCLLTESETLGSFYLDLKSEDVKEVLFRFIFEQGDFSAVNWEFLRQADEKAAVIILEMLPHLLPHYDKVLVLMVDWFSEQDIFVQQSLVYALVSSLALMGRPEQIEQVVGAYLKGAGKENAAAENVCFVADMLRGEVTKARERGDKFKDYLNDLNGSKKKEMPYLIGGYYAVLLSFGASVVELKSALTFTRSSIKKFKNSGLQESIAFHFLKLLQEYFMCRQVGTRISFKPNSISTETCKLWANVMLQWEGQHADLFHLKPTIVEGNTRLELEARACGLILNSESSDEAEKKLKSLMSHQGISPLAGLREPEPEWEDLLNVLEAVEAPKSKVKDKVTERLVWRVDFEETYINPYYQKKQKAGWSKGRDIALRTIYSAIPKYATDVDIQIINCLKRKDGWYGVEYYWDYAKCMPLLIDHPLLFTEENPMLPVDLKKEEVSFIVKDKNGELHLSLSNDMSNAIVKEGERRYKYLVLDEGVRSVTGMMSNKGLDTVIFPKGAKGRVVKALNKLSKRLAISCDFVDPNT